MAKHYLRLHVTHNGQRLEKGSECPAEFVDVLAPQGLLLTEEEQSAVVAAEKVKALGAPKPVEAKAEAVEPAVSQRNVKAKEKVEEKRA